MVSSSDTLLVVSTLDIVQDCHLRPFLKGLIREVSKDFIAIV